MLFPRVEEGSGEVFPLGGKPKYGEGFDCISNDSPLSTAKPIIESLSDLHCENLETNPKKMLGSPEITTSQSFSFILVHTQPPAIY